MFDSTPFLQNSAAFERLVNQTSHSRTNYEAKFQAALKSIPAPGYGLGCHPRLLGVASCGILAWHTDDEIFVAIRSSIPKGGRVVSDKDIWDAIKRARSDTFPAGSNPSVQPTTRVPSRVKLSKTEATEIKKRVLSYSNGPVKLDSDEFRKTHGFQLEPQPIMPLHPEAFTMIQLIRELYAPNDLLYIGPERMQDSGKVYIRAVAEWIAFFKGQQEAILERIGNEGWNSPVPSAFLMELGRRYSHIIPNPVTGRYGEKKGGGLSLRCDGCIRSFKHAVIDFDCFETLEEQGEVLHCLCEAMGIRICALTYTGGRGVHALVRIDGVETLKDWNKIVRDGLFPTFEALGADPACFNPSRGTRLPGVFRCETSRWQKLLLVSREGVRI